MSFKSEIQNSISRATNSINVLKKSKPVAINNFHTPLIATGSHLGATNASLGEFCSFNIQAFSQGLLWSLLALMPKIIARISTEAQFPETFREAFNPRFCFLSSYLIYLEKKDL